MAKVDDLRFYNDSLTTDEITAVFNDDVSSSIPAASKRQVIYDEGTDTTGPIILLMIPSPVVATSAIREV